MWSLSISPRQDSLLDSRGTRTAALSGLEPSLSSRARRAWRALSGQWDGIRYATGTSEATSYIGREVMPCTALALLNSITEKDEFVDDDALFLPLAQTLDAEQWPSYRPANSERASNRPGIFVV